MAGESWLSKYYHNIYKKEIKKNPFMVFLKKEHVKTAEQNLHLSLSITHVWKHSLNIPSAVTTLPLLLQGFIWNQLPARAWPPSDRLEYEKVKINTIC